MNRTKETDALVEAAVKVGTQMLGEWMHSKKGDAPSAAPADASAPRQDEQAHPSADSKRAGAGTDPRSVEGVVPAMGPSPGSEVSAALQDGSPARSTGTWGTRIVSLAGIVVAGAVVLVAAQGVWHSFAAYKAAPPSTHWFQSEEDVIRMSFNDSAVQERTQRLRAQIEACAQKGSCAWTSASGPETVPQLSVAGKDAGIDCREPCEVAGDTRVPVVHLQVRANGDIVEWALHNGENIGLVEHPFKAEQDAQTTVGWHSSTFAHE